MVNWLALWCEEKVKFELGLNTLLGLVWLEVDNEIVLDGEDGVGCEPWVVLRVDLGDNGVVVWVGHLGIVLVKLMGISGTILKPYHHVNVSWTHWVTVEKSEKLVRWTVGWERVGSWAETDKAVLSVLVGPELSTKVVVLLVLLVLEVVLAVGGSLPKVDNGVLDWLLGNHVLDNTVHAGDKTAWSWAVNNGLAKVPEWSVWRPEWTKNGGGGWRVTSLGDLVVCNLGDEAATVS